ncbi:MAG: hypothetical protein KatS3mg107_0680 [Gemmataceae bacterium]|jgi:hypothetical protein|nr:MAG: hypothetical protein KatS3mg107_0680 [Gemmataceae bacterium]
MREVNPSRGLVANEGEDLGDPGNASGLKGAGAFQYHHDLPCSAVVLLGGEYR